MELAEIKKILRHIEDSYVDFTFTKDMYEYWNKELQYYDYSDIFTRLKELMGEDRYHYKPPFLEAITRGISKAKDKVDFTKQVYYCKHCGKAFNDLSQTHNHEDRCSAIKYIERQYIRFNLGDIDNQKKYELYNMSESEFDEKYKIILKYVQQHTTNDVEKLLIENVFNPPNIEKAKNMINS